MNLSSLDNKLADDLRPLVEIKAVMRVAPFVNTLPLGLHYFLAHGDDVPSGDQIALADWNRMGDSDEQVSGVYVFYSTKEISEILTGPVDSGLYDSLPVSRFRQRLVFCRRTKQAEELAKAIGYKFGSRFFQEATDRGLEVTTYTDVFAQTERLMSASVPEGSPTPAVRCFGRWPKKAFANKKDLPLFVYGAPCTAYMDKAKEAFITFEVEDSIVGNAAEYETHVIWHVPEGRTEWAGLIRGCMTSYHRNLYEGVAGTSDAEFTAMASACNDTLAERHPSFPAEIFSKPKAFRLCLRNHHAQPGR